MKINYKELIFGFLIVFGIILIFAGFDYLIHLTSAEYSVPSRYFPNKIIYGTLIGFITYLFIKNKKPVSKAIIFSSVVAILLQIRYFIEGYPLDFVVTFLFIHFFILLITSWIVFNKFKQKKAKRK